MKILEKYTDDLIGLILTDNEEVKLKAKDILHDYYAAAFTIGFNAGYDRGKEMNDVCKYRFKIEYEDYFPGKSNG